MNRRQPVVSVIVPTYNSGGFLLETIASILNQDYRNIELITIDDASTDDTWSTLRSLRDSRLRLFRNKTNHGIAYTRNRGLKLAQGKYIAFFDHDDIMLPHSISDRINHLEHERGAAAFGFPKAVIDKQGAMLKRFSRQWFSRNYVRLLNFCRLCRVIDLRPFRALLPAFFPELTDLILARSLARKAGYFDLSLSLADDSDYICRLAQLTQFNFVDTPTKLKRLHRGNALTRTPTLSNQELIRVSKRYGAYIPSRQ